MTREKNARVRLSIFFCYVFSKNRKDFKRYLVLTMLSVRTFQTSGNRIMLGVVSCIGKERVIHICSVSEAKDGWDDNSGCLFS
jgi:hypothetical protein